MVAPLRHIAALCVAYLAADSPFAPLADAQAEPDGSAVNAAPEIAQATVDGYVQIEGSRVPVRLRTRADRPPLIYAEPIFAALQSRANMDGTVLSYARYQDGAQLSLDMADGKVSSGDIVLGHLPDWDAQNSASFWLTPNAVAVLTGTHVAVQDDGSYAFSLDDRLKPQFDLDLFVEGRRLAFLDEEPRSIGPIILLPLRDIVDALGHELIEDSDAGTVTVVRIQDAVELTLDLATGLVSVNGQPRGVTPAMSYADRDLLLLPDSAVETLTGTHVELPPGSNRVDVRLDSRLTGSVLPSRTIASEVEDTGIKLESLTYQIGDRGQTSARLQGYSQTIDATVRYESAGNPLEGGGSQPRWMGVDLNSLSGDQLRLGDVQARNRELSGVNQSRVRGAAYQHFLDNGDVISLVAGAPVSGSRRIDDDVSVPTFSGLVAGVRHLSADGHREFGLSAEFEDDSEATLVAGLQHDLKIAPGSGNWQLDRAYISAELGGFNRPSQNTQVDFRGQTNLGLTYRDQVRVQGALTHEGKAFRGDTGQSSADNFDGVFDTRIASRTGARLSADWRAVEDWGVLNKVAAGARISATQEGDSTSRTLSLSSSARLGENGLDLSASLTGTRTDAGDGSSALSNTNATLRARKQYVWGLMQANLTSSKTENEDRRTQLVANVSAHPLDIGLRKGAELSVAPVLSAVMDNDTARARLGASLRGNSGRAFGDKFRLDGQVSALQSIDPGESRTEFFTHLRARYDVSPGLQIEARYTDNFRGSTSVNLGLRGTLKFNPPRRYGNPDQDLGLLEGQAFFDRNRDGQRQSDEPGIPGAVVSVRRTRLALATNPQGFYTIQGMPSGLYTLDLDTRSLPLGFQVPDETPLRATIGAGMITRLDIPVVASGQIRGTVFTDTNGNGQIDPGEPRHESARLTLESLNQGQTNTRSQVAAAFGQYGFENVTPGTYRLHTRIGDRTVSVNINLTEDNLLQTVPLPLPAPPIDSPQVEVAGLLARDVKSKV